MTGTSGLYVWILDSWSADLSESFFMFEDPFFSIQPARISDQVSRWSDHSMAGDYDEDWIFVIGSTDGSDGSRISCEFCLFSVVSSFSIGDFPECLPCVLLEFCSMRRKREIKRSPSSSKIFRELEPCLWENWIIVSSSRYGLLSVTLDKIEHDKILILSNCSHLSDWCRNNHCIHISTIWKKLPNDSFYCMSFWNCWILLIFPENVITPPVSLRFTFSVARNSFIIWIFPVFVPDMVPWVRPSLFCILII